LTPWVRLGPLAVQFLIGDKQSLGIFWDYNAQGTIHGASVLI
jgi:hypothetical protein